MLWLRSTPPPMLGPDIGAFQGTTFDGRYVYFAPAIFGASANGSLITRYDTQADFTTPSSWSTFDLAAVDLRVRWCGVRRPLRVPRAARARWRARLRRSDRPRRRSLRYSRGLHRQEPG